VSLGVRSLPTLAPLQKVGHIFAELILDLTQSDGTRFAAVRAVDDSTLDRPVTGVRVHYIPPKVDQKTSGTALQRDWLSALAAVARLLQHQILPFAPCFLPYILLGLASRASIGIFGLVRSCTRFLPRITHETAPAIEATPSRPRANELMCH
jgi:hypothetical protein